VLSRQHVAGVLSRQHVAGVLSRQQVAGVLSRQQVAGVRRKRSGRASARARHVRLAPIHARQHVFVVALLVALVPASSRRAQWVQQQAAGSTQQVCSHGVGSSSWAGCCCHAVLRVSTTSFV
jgi:hypothetical protein